MTTEKPRKFKALTNKRTTEGELCITRGKVYDLVLKTRGTWVVVDDLGENYSIFQRYMEEVIEPDYALIAYRAACPGAVCSPAGFTRAKYERAARAVIEAYEEVANA